MAIIYEQEHTTSLFFKPLSTSVCGRTIFVIYKTKMDPKNVY